MQKLALGKTEKKSSGGGGNGASQIGKPKGGAAWDKGVEIKAAPIKNLKAALRAACQSHTSKSQGRSWRNGFFVTIGYRAGKRHLDRLLANIAKAKAKIQAGRLIARKRVKGGLPKLVVKIRASLSAV